MNNMKKSIKLRRSFEKIYNGQFKSHVLRCLADIVRTLLFEMLQMNTHRENWRSQDVTNSRKYETKTVYNKEKKIWEKKTNR